MNRFSKIQTKFLIGASKVKNRVFKNKKGEVNTVAVLVIIAVFLVITYPMYKTLISGFMSGVQTWFSNTSKNIFA